MADKPVDKPKSPTKTEIINQLVEESGLTKKDVVGLLEALASVVGKNIGKKGPGAFTVPGLLEITRKYVPAKPAQKNVRNPFTGEMRDVPAKKARWDVKVRPLKALKDMV